MQTIPLQPIPAQTCRVVLDGQNCSLSIVQKSQGVFVDIAVDGVDVALAVLALDAVPINCREYAGFAGNLMFIDTQGASNPDYSGIGTRYMLVYLTADEYALI